MGWHELADTIVARVLLAAVSGPHDVSVLMSLERRIRHLVQAASWRKAAAHAYLGQGLCAALLLKSSRSEPDWKALVQRASQGHFCCTPAPELSGPRSDRSGHAAVLLKSSLLVIFGGVRRPTADSDFEHAQAIAELAVMDLEHLRWLSVNESTDWQSGPSTPLPRWKPTLTDNSFASACLVGGQTYDGPGKVSFFSEVWQLNCGNVDASNGALACEWRPMTLSGCHFPARSCHTAVRADCGVLVLGGVGAEGHVLPCEAYCLQGSEWTLPSQSGLLPPQGAVHHACHFQGMLVLVGGVDDAGLQRRGLGRPTDVYVLDLNTWIWERLLRHPLSPSLHSFSAMLVFGSRLFIFGGNSACAGGKSDFESVAIFDMKHLATTSSCPGQARQAQWSQGAAVGISSQVVGHTLAGGVLLGGNHRTDGKVSRTSVSLFWPHIKVQQAQSSGTRKPGAPRWFKR